MPRERPAVRPLVGHRVERVAHRQDPRGKRDVLSRKRVRVAGAVPALVVSAYPRQRHRSCPSPRRSARPAALCSWMWAHSFGVRAVGLPQDALGHADVADVVQQRREIERAQFVLGQTERAADRDGSSATC